jgi:hypothetical protein
MLFTYQPTALEDWRAKERWTTSPVEVRKAIERCNVLLPIDQDRYKVLSGLAAHADPEFAPAAHNVLARPVSPAYFQVAGVLLALNEAGWPLIFSTVRYPSSPRCPCQLIGQ